MPAEASWVPQDKSHDFGSESGLISSQDDTDEFGQIIMQHARDEQRISRMLDGQRQQPFRKAKTGMGISTALNNLEVLRDAERQSLSSGTSDPGTYEHTLTNGSEPPLNVPREWGRKARHSNGWLRRLKDGEEEPARPISADGMRPRIAGNAIDGTIGVDWAEAAQPEPRSIKRATPLLARSRQYAAPFARTARENDSLDRIRQWESDQDFTAGSLIESTPAITSTLLLTREGRYAGHANGYGHAVATGRLSHISEQSSRIDIDKLESRMSRLSARPLNARVEPSTDVRRQSQHRSSRDKENAAPNGIKHAFHVTATIEGKDRTETSRDELAEHARPQISRAESLDMLKRLARVASQSPSPAQAELATATNPARPKAAALEPRTVRQSSAQAPEVVEIAMERTSAHSASDTKLDPKTPKVVGGWVDTPYTKRNSNVATVLEAKPVDAVTKVSDDQPASIGLGDDVKPAPRSALSALLHPLKSINSTSGTASTDLKLSDDTLRSLESLLEAPTTELTADLSNTLQLQDVQLELDRLHKLGRPMTRLDEQRRDELLAIQGMNDRLRVARQGVREVGKGLRGVERAVEAATSPALLSPDHRRHNRRYSAVQHASVLAVAAQEIASLFIRPSDTPLSATATTASTRHSTIFSSLLPRRLTMLGSCALLALTWYLLESAACAATCHATLAPSMRGFGVDPDAPSWPFALPTLALRPFSWFWRPVLGMALWVLKGLGSAIGAYFALLWEEDGSASRSKEGTREQQGWKGSAGQLGSLLWADGSGVGAQEKVATGRKAGRQDTASSSSSSSSSSRFWSGGAGESMDADLGVDETEERKGLLGFARLWSWRESPVTASTSMYAIKSMATAVAEVHVADSQWDAWDNDGDSASQDMPVWETGDGMGADEVT